MPPVKSDPGYSTACQLRSSTESHPLCIASVKTQVVAVLTHKNQRLKRREGMGKVNICFNPGDQLNFIASHNCFLQRFLLCNVTKPVLIPSA